MAKSSSKKDIKLVRKVSFVFIHKLAAGISLLALFVIVVAGLMANASVVSMAYRSLIAILVIGMASRILVRILATYEEIDSV